MYNISTTNIVISECLIEELDIIPDGSEYLLESDKWNIVNIIPDESECLYYMKSIMPYEFIPDENKPII